MILIDDVPFSKEAWEWFTQRRVAVNKFVNGSNVIAQFIRPYLHEGIRNGPGRKSEYQELTAGELWEVFYTVYMLMADILKSDKPPLPTNVTTEQLKHELKVIEDMMVALSIGDGFTQEQLSGLNKDFISADRDSTTMSFCINVFCMQNVIWLKFQKLTELLYGREVPELNRINKSGGGYADDTPPEFYGRDADLCEFMRFVVRKCCAGDFDDFIISVKNAIAEEAITPYHMELAKVYGYEMMGMADFCDMEKKEAWRRLFTSYFDEVETNYDLFYREYPRQCYWFLLMSYLSIESGGGISYIPIYRIYSTNNFTKSYETDVKRLFDTRLIRTKCKKMYNLKIPVK